MYFLLHYLDDAKFTAYDQISTLFQHVYYIVYCTYLTTLPLIPMPAQPYSLTTRETRLIQEPEACASEKKSESFSVL